MYEFLSPKFLEAMNDIGKHGFEKYGDDIKGYDGRKPGERWTRVGIGKHISEHFTDYCEGKPHDNFQTRRHQLAAAAYNAFMEYIFAGLEDE